MHLSVLESVLDSARFWHLSARIPARNPALSAGSGAVPRGKTIERAPKVCASKMGKPQKSPQSHGICTIKCAKFLAFQ